MAVNSDFLHAAFTATVITISGDADEHSCSLCSGLARCKTIFAAAQACLAPSSIHPLELDIVRSLPRLTLRGPGGKNAFIPRPARSYFTCRGSRSTSFWVRILDQQPPRFWLNDKFAANMRGTNSSVETNVYYTPGRKLKRTLTNQMRCIRKYNGENFFRRTGRTSIAEDERFPALLRLGRGGCIIDNVVSIDRESLRFSLASTRKKFRPSSFLYIVVHKNRIAFTINLIPLKIRISYAYLSSVCLQLCKNVDRPDCTGWSKKRKKEAVFLDSRSATSIRLTLSHFLC